MTKLSISEVQQIKKEAWAKGVLVGSLFASIILGTVLHVVIMKLA